MSKDNKTIPQVRSKKIIQFFFLLVIVATSIQLTLSNTVMITEAATQTEAFESITTAFEKIEQASREGIDVQTFIDDLNTALSKYHEGDFDGAYDLAESILVDVTETLNNARWGKVFPYVIIPINIVLIAGIIVFFGRNILGWFRRKRDEEYLDLEIVYQTDALEEEKKDEAATTE